MEGLITNLSGASIPDRAFSPNLLRRPVMIENSHASIMEELPTHIPTPEQHPAGSWSLGALLSVLAAIFLAYILRLAVPNEDNAIELGILLIAVGFAQIWLIFNFLKAIRK